MSDDELIKAAIKVLEERAKYEVIDISSPSAARDLLRLKMAGLEHEEFWAVWLNTQNQVIDMEMLFRGTLSQTSVYPRELVKSALARNAAAVILAHNHPSGVAEPSRADALLTNTLKTTLALVDVKVLDHLVVAGADVASFAERGLI